VSISVYKQNYSDSTASIVTRFSAVWLLCFPRTKDDVKGKGVQYHNHRQQKWQSSPKWTLACSRIPCHPSLYLASILQFLTPAFLMSCHIIIPFYFGPYLFFPLFIIYNSFWHFTMTCSDHMSCPPKPAYLHHYHNIRFFKQFI
jgi:hypothetical protein